MLLSLFIGWFFLNLFGIRPLTEKYPYALCPDFFMRINTNLSSLSTQSKLETSRSALRTSIERLSSGLRINSAADDAAGLGISNRMESRIRGKDQALRNARDASSMLATVDSGVDAILAHVQRIRELAVQKESDTYSMVDKISIQREIEQNLNEINRLSMSISFNGMPFGVANDKTIQVGEGDGDVDSLDIAFKGLSATTIGLGRSMFDDMSEPLDAVVVGGGSSKSPGTYPITDATFNMSFYTQPGVSSSKYLELNGREEIAAYYGISPDEIQIRKWTSEHSNAYVVQIGDNFYYNGWVDAKTTTTGQGAWINSDGTAGIRIRPGWSSFDVYDPDTGTVSPAGPISSGHLGKTIDGQTVRYVVYNNKTYTYSTNAGGTYLKQTIYPNREVQLMPADYITKADNAIEYLSEYKAYLGAMMNRLDSVANGLADGANVTRAAQSRVQDADYALEVSNMTRAQILQQAGQAVLAQANQIPQGVLSMLK